MMKKILSIALALAVLSCLTAFAGGTGESAPAKKIVIGSEAGTGWTQHLMAQSKIWTQKTGTEVEFAGVPYTDMANKYLTEMVSKSGAYDAISVNRDGFLIPFAAAGYLEPLENILTKAEWSDFFPIAIETATWKGHIYAVPQNMAAEGLYYRTDLLSKYGLKPPTTWDDLLKDAQTITSSNTDGDQVSVYGMGLKAKRYTISGHWVLDFMYENGATVLDSSGNVTVNSPKAVEALQFMVDLLNKYKVVSPGSLNDDETSLHNAFMAGKVGMLQNWPYMFTLANDPKQSQVVGQFDIELVPGQVKRGTVCGGWGFAVPADSRNKKAVEDWLHFVTRPEADKIYVLNYETQPAHLSTFDDPDVKAKYGKWFDTLKLIINSSFATPKNAKWMEMSEVLQDALQNALTQKMTAQDALDDAAAKLKKLTM